MDMTALESICVYVSSNGETSLQKIIQDKQPRPWGVYFGLAEIADGSLDKELMGYGCPQLAVSKAIDAVLKEQLYTEVIVGKV